MSNFTPTCASLFGVVLISLTLTACKTDTTLRTSSWEVAGCGSIVWNGRSASGETTRECYHETQGRPVSVLSECPNEDRSGLLCYPPCKEGYTGVGPVCWEKDCPAGYRDDGATCFRDAHIISANNDACPWYNKCGFGSSCSKCPAGYDNDGCTCRRDPDLIWKKSYGRGVGSPMSCAPGKERIGALCYGECPAGFKKSGIHCVADAETCRDVPVQKPADYSDVGLYCFKEYQKGSSPNTYNFCSTHQIYSDTEERAKQAAQLCCLDCTVEKIACGEVTTACAPKPAPTGPTPMPTPGTSMEGGSWPDNAPRLAGWAGDRALYRLVHSPTHTLSSELYALALPARGDLPSSLPSKCVP